MPIASHRPRRLVAALVALALALAPAAAPPPISSAAAQALPDLGDVAQATFSPAQERKLGEAIMRQARASGGLLNDPEVNDYLNELGNRLVAASPDARQDFEFFAVPERRHQRFRPGLAPLRRDQQVVEKFREPTPFVPHLPQRISCLQCERSTTCLDSSAVYKEPRGEYE